MKTSELTGAALNWAVAKCVALGIDHLRIANKKVYIKDQDTLIECKFHEDWAQGGPIIDREQISTYPDVSNTWIAQRRTWLKDGAVSVQRQWHWGSGSTLLIAAMRCFVASKLGDEIELPKELI